MAARARNGGAIPLALALVAYVLALLQRAGLDTSDTKINLHVDPGRFLGDVASVWSQAGSLGHVQGGQYSGYLWPMGPFFALGHTLGIADSVTERLWLGTLLALAAWGAVRLLDELLERRRGAAHVVAGAAYMLNPYVVVMASRTTVSLLAYAALPWLLVSTHRGLHSSRRWWWAAAFALITTSTGAGVNATVTGFVLLGPILLVVYEVWVKGASLRSAGGFGWRVAAATAAASVWWVVPLLVQSHYGLNFLQFTEQVGSIWATTSVSESVRLMGYWPTYLGVGFADTLIPYFGNASTMLFNPAAVTATLLVPALALTGYRWTRSWRYGPFFLLTAVVSLLIMTVSWPEGTPGRRAATFLYNHLTALQFLRTTYKAGPLLAIAIAALAGAAARLAWPRLSGWRRPAAAVAALGLIGAAALPFFEGRALELTWRSIPSAWRQAGSDLNRELPPNSRAMVLPGQAYAYYRWGGTVDPVLPTLTTRPVAVRNVPPFDDLHAVDFMWTVDDLVQQQRLLPRQLPPLLDLMSVRSVLTPTDDNTALSGAVAPAVAAGELASQPGFARPARAYGPVRRFPPPPGSAAGPVTLPQLRRYDLPARGLVRVEPRGGATVVDGSAQGVADVAALGELPASRPLLYAGDLSAPALRRQALAGAEVFITDSNRRRVYVPSRMLQNTGPTMSALDPFSPDAAVIDPFTAAGSAAQTVTQYEGVRDLRSPYDPQLAQFPEHRPFAAFDGDPGTSWFADGTLAPSRQWLEADFGHPRGVPYLDLLPDQSSSQVRLTEVTVNGRLFHLHPGWNRLITGLRGARFVRIGIAHVHLGPRSTATGVGLAEVRIPGVRVRELLRPPVVAERALRGAGLRHATLAYLFERTTTAAPLQRGAATRQVIPRGDRLQQEAALIRQAQDPELGLARTIDPPVARRWTVSGLATVSANARDSSLDRLAGTATAGATLWSSGRLEGRPGYRASSAFDGSAATAWAAPEGAGERPWIAWATPAPQTLRRLVVVRSALPVRFPTAVALAGSRGETVTAPVAADGSVALPRPLRGRAFRLTVLAASGSAQPAVAVAEVRGAGIPRVGRAAQAVAGRCGDELARVGRQSVALRLSGSVAALNAGEPLRVVACGAPVALPAQPTDVTIAPAVVRPLIVQLRSVAPEPVARGLGGDAVLSAGRAGRSVYDGIRVAVGGPSWLVLGQSYNAGWRASCNGRSLGAPRVLDGFANGWAVQPGCRNVSLSFAPQTEVEIGYAIGAFACLLLLLGLLVARPGPPARPRAAPAWSAPDTPSPWPPLRALAAGLVAAACFGFVFGLRAGAVVGPACALLQWRGVSNRRLVLGAGALLVLAVPLLYVVFPGRNQGGYDPGYAGQHLAAHWTTVAALALLTLALARDLAARVSMATDRPRDARATPPPGAVR